MLILLILWLWRIHFNARQLGARGMRFTLVDFVIWWVVPFANLWMPFLAVQEVWKTARNPLNWEKEPSSLLISFWWLFFVLSSGLTLRLMLIPPAKGAGEELVYQWYGAFGSSVAAAFLAWIWVGRAERIQRAYWASLGEDARSSLAGAGTGLSAP
jgi:hypothetical protein